MPPGTFLTSSRKTFLGGLIAFFLSNRKVPGNFFILIAMQSELCDKLRFRSQKLGTLMFCVACAYVPNFFRISFETEPRLFFFLLPWLNVAASLRLFFIFSLHYRSEAAHVKHVRSSGTRKTVQAGIFVLCLFRYPKSLIRIGET